MAAPEVSEIDPAANPFLTNAQGYFGWEVPDGCWYVVVRANGYETLTGPLVGVTEEAGISNLNLALTRAIVAVEQIAISGPTLGLEKISHSFTATVLPATTAEPVSYTWLATGQMPITRTGSLSDTASFIWQTPGLQTITVTAENATGSATIQPYNHHRGGYSAR